ncbi:MULTISPECIES: ATP synthase [unclassified Synechococcus]|uniref:ATP synthase n=1 Tax=unclassified Synechococcus TaxID=2626047 RepID=UPI002001B5AA|nr:ATP synthase [Synechococcus sp. A10-1-5-1]UPM49801.1 ATP synthase [Synechococcus sp. A10-1-5-1]
MEVTSLETELNQADGALDDPMVVGADSSLDDFDRLQRRLILATVLVAASAVPITALIFDLHTAISVLIGGLGGALYMRLLARSVGKLAQGSKKVGKLQLLVPVVLVMAAIRLPELEILPIFLGFLLYKPVVIFQALSDL